MTTPVPATDDLDLPTPLRALRATMAFGGLLLLGFVLWAVPKDGDPVPAWIVRFYVIWAVAVPYWHCDGETRRFRVIQADTPNTEESR